MYRRPREAITDLRRRYLFYTTCHDDTKPFDRLDEIPNIVMTICVDTFAIKETGVSHIRLYRPVSSATAWTILETPWRQAGIADAPLSHEMCTSGLHLMSMLQVVGMLGPAKPEHMPFTDIPVSKECREMQSMPAVRPVSDIRKVVLVKGAYLHDRPPARLPPVKTNLQLHNLEIKASGTGIMYKDLLVTAVELMKLAAMQVNGKNLVDAEKKLVPHHGFGNARFGASTCFLRLGYADWHVNLTLNMSNAKVFVEMVSDFELP